MWALSLAQSLSGLSALQSAGPCKAESLQPGKEVIPSPLPNVGIICISVNNLCCVCKITKVSDLPGLESCIPNPTPPT